MKKRGMPVLSKKSIMAPKKLVRSKKSKAAKSPRSKAHKSTHSSKHKAHKTSKATSKAHKSHKSPRVHNIRSSNSERVQTYIPQFDKLIEGGFEKNTTNLLVGSAGAGKTIFATQFLVGGLKNGETCLFVTFEEKKSQFYENMKRFGWDLEEYERKGLFTFLEYSPRKVKTMLEEGGGAIESIILRKKVSRIVIDSITSFALLFNDELEKREAALNLFNMISNWNCTSLITFEGDPLKEENAAARAIEFESDAIIILYFVKDRAERRRLLEILKMRGTKHSKETYGFEISSSGVSIKGRVSSNVGK